MKVSFRLDTRLLLSSTVRSQSCSAASYAPFYSASKLKQSLSFASSSSSCSCRLNCCYNDSSRGKKNIGDSETEPLTILAAYDVLGLDPSSSSSSAQLKAAFRSKVKQFHPDVTGGRKENDSDIKIRRVIEAYQMLSNFSKSEIIERECMDPFDQPECEALDLFVNEVLCIGQGCPYSCVDRAPHAFKYSSQTGTARATSQGHGEDYQVQLAAGQCPKSCIHFVTPSQRIVLEELLDGILNKPYGTSIEAELLYSLIMKAKYENNRYRNPKRKAKVSGTQHVDWF